MKTQDIKVSSVLIGSEIKDHQTISITDDLIVDISPSEDTNDELQGLLVPGFIDVQVNGGGGVLFNENPSLKSITAITKAHQKFGTTGLLPTLITDALDKMELAAEAIAEARTQNVPSVLGVHFEGPHLETSKKGVHSASYIRSLSKTEEKIYSRKDLGKIIITLAPENVSVNGIRDLVAEGVIVCLGHSNASFAQTQAAIEAGATGFTHLYNAMSPLTSREPGMVGAALLAKNTYSGLIADNIHVHPKSMDIAIQSATEIMLVTDAMPPVGSEEKSFEFFGQCITRDNDTLRDKEGRLAGSALDMASAVANICKLKSVSLSDAIKMASLNPAKFLKLDDDYGTIGKGKKASMLLLNQDIQVTHNWVDGNKISI